MNIQFNLILYQELKRDLLKLIKLDKVYAEVKIYNISFYFLKCYFYFLR